jgi:hypothetical protein
MFCILKNRKPTEQTHRTKNATDRNMAECTVHDGYYYNKTKTYFIHFSAILTILYYLLYDIKFHGNNLPVNARI